MRKRKQILSILLATAMMSVLFNGCGQQEVSDGESTAESTVTSVSASESSTVEAETDASTGDSGKISEEVITLTVAGPYTTGATSDWSATQQFEEYERRLGIKFEATTYEADAWANQRTLMLAGDELPDMLANASISAAQLAEYGADGYFLDFSEYLDVMPNLQAIMEEYPAYAAMIKDDSGHIYGFPKMNERIASNLMQINLINIKWLENVGMEMPESLDDLYKVLVAFKEQDANGNGDPDDEIPFGMALGDGSVTYSRTEHFIRFAFGINSQDYVYNMMVDAEGNVVLGDVTDNYKAFLQYMSTLYSEGLMNQDAYVLTMAEYKTLVSEDRFGISCATSSAYPDITNYRQLVGYTSEYSPEPTITLTSRVGTTFNIVANADTEYPEEIAKFVDYLFTIEGALSASNGYEGVTFDYVDGIINHTNYASGYETAEIYRQQKAVAMNAFSIYTINEGTIYDAIRNATVEELSPGGKVYEIAGSNALKEIPLKEREVIVYDSYPAVKYTDEELKERATLYTDISNYLTNAKAEFIIGKRNLDADWDAHIANLEKMGLSRLMEIEQAAYDRYLESIK